MEIKIQYLTVGRWKENSYLLEYENEAWLMDPGEDFNLLDDHFQTSSKNLKGVINTHGHFDHLGAVSEFQSKYSIPFYIHSLDRQLVRQANLYRRLAGDHSVYKTPQIAGDFNDQSLTVSNKSIKVHHTPGHTNGSVCFEIDNNLISGDLLFKENIGRIDLPGGNRSMLHDSIEYVLSHFIGYTIYPGHGEPFTLDEAVVEKLKGLM